MEKIEVGYRLIGEGPFGKDYYHKFLLYTDKDGNQYTISGWTDENNLNPNLPFGNIRVKANEKYDFTNNDHPDNPNTWNYDENFNFISVQKQYRELIIESPDLSETWMKMVVNAQSKDNMYPYDYLRQNSNTLADNVLRDAGLPEPELDGMRYYFAPGSGKAMDQNLVPKNPNNRRISDIRHLSYLKENDLDGNPVQAQNQHQPQTPDLTQPLRADASDAELIEYGFAALLAENEALHDQGLKNLLASTQAEQFEQAGIQAVLQLEQQQQQAQRPSNPVMTM